MIRLISTTSLFLLLLLNSRNNLQRAGSEEPGKTGVMGGSDGAWAGNDPLEHEKVNREIEEWSKNYPRNFLPYTVNVNTKKMVRIDNLIINWLDENIADSGK